MQHGLKQTKDSYLVLEKGFEICLEQGYKINVFDLVKSVLQQLFKLFQANIFL
jgi:hypothetical protein